MCVCECERGDFVVAPFPFRRPSLCRHNAQACQNVVNGLFYAFSHQTIPGLLRWVVGARPMLSGVDASKQQKRGENIRLCILSLSLLTRLFRRNSTKRARRTLFSTFYLSFSLDFMGMWSRASISRNLCARAFDVYYAPVSTFSRHSTLWHTHTRSLLSLGFLLVGCDVLRRTCSITSPTPHHTHTPPPARGESRCHPG